MKKYLFFSLMAVLLGFSACTYYVEPEGDKTCKFHSFTRELPVNQSDWQFDSEQEMFYAYFNLPEITNEVYKYGVISLCHEYNHGASNAYYVALPETMYKWENVTNDDGSTSTVYYQLKVDYVVKQGGVEIDVAVSDFYYPTSWTPEAMHFRLQAVY